MVLLLGAAAIIGILGWAASPVINRLIGKAKSYAAKKYKWHKDVPEKLARVGNLLDEIGSIVSSVEARGFKDPSMISWLSHLKGAVDEVDDFFDILDKEIVSHNADADDDRPAAAEARSSGTVGSEKSSDSLDKLLEKLEGIRKSSRGLVQVSMLAGTSSSGFSDGSRSSSSGTCSSPVTGPCLAQEPVGYSDEYKLLMDRLVPDLNKLKQGRAVVAIIGHGGMGKTTLAQKACNDPSVKSRFGLIIWACVHSRFREADVLGEIWRSAAAATDLAGHCVGHGEVSFSSMQQALAKLVASKRYLLVLDAVCNDETATELQSRETWSKVLAPFQHAESGSRVLLTTRAMICAQTVGADRSMRIILNGIDEESFETLVKRSAAFESADDDTLQMVLVSSSAALFSTRSPLSAKEIGLKLRRCRSKKKWERILATDCHENVISAHAWSYQQLTPHLQYCLAFISLYPYRSKFRAEMLVKLWVAHGFIVGDGDGALEDTAAGFFNDLLSRSFFQEIKKGRTTQYYMVQEQIHSMVRSVSANHFLMVQGNGDSAAKRIPQTVRHLSLTITTGCCLGCLLAQLKKQSVLKRLRTLLLCRGHPGPMKLCVACASLAVIDKDLLSELNGVRVLDLTGTEIAWLPPEIGNLIHLRYLALPDTLKVLPQEVSKLLHLQALSQTAESDHDDGNNLGQPFKFCGKEGLSQLAGMNSLRGALILTGLDAVTKKQDSQKAQLSKKKGAKELKLEWDHQSGIPDQHEGVLEGLRPYKGIQTLQIQRYRGTSSPSWLLSNRLEQLTHLYVINCRKWAVLPAFGHLPRLNHLHIQEMESVVQIDGSGRFESLETLELQDMKCLVEWTTIGPTDSGFPILKNMKILDCPELKILLPPMLREAVDKKIQGCPKLP